MNQISQQMTTILSALAGAERIFEVMDTMPEVDEGQVTLTRAEKDANGTLSAYSGEGRTGVWAWRVPRNGKMALVPVRIEGKDILTELEKPGKGQEHGWAWKYLDHNGEMSLHRIRGSVRNVPGEDYYLTESGNPCFYFQPGAIAPEEEGVPTFVIDLWDLEDEL